MARTVYTESVLETVFTVVGSGYVVRTRTLVACEARTHAHTDTHVNTLARTHAHTHVNNLRNGKLRQ